MKYLGFRAKFSGLLLPHLARYGRNAKGTPKQTLKKWDFWPFKRNLCIYVLDNCQNFFLASDPPVESKIIFNEKKVNFIYEFVVIYWLKLLRNVGKKSFFYFETSLQLANGSKRLKHSFRASSWHVAFIWYPYCLGRSGAKTDMDIFKIGTFIILPFMYEIAIWALDWHSVQFNHIEAMWSMIWKKNT